MSDLYIVKNLNDNVLVIPENNVLFYNFQRKLLLISIIQIQIDLDCGT